MSAAPGGRFQVYYEKIRQEVTKIKNDNNYLNLSKAFAHWYLNNFLDIQEIDLGEIIIDGDGDKGIDAAIIQNGCMALYQFKFPDKPDNITKKINETTALKLLNGYKKLNAKTKPRKANEVFLSFRESIRTENIFKYSFQFISYTDGLSDNALDALDIEIEKIKRETGNNISIEVEDKRIICDKFDRKQRKNSISIPFHSMSSNNTVTTEKALRRLYALNIKVDSPLSIKTIEYLVRLIKKEEFIPDRREKAINWDVFCSLMFASWLYLFCVKIEEVLHQRDIWIKLIEDSIKDNAFNELLYKEKFQLKFGKLNFNERSINPFSFYPVVLLKNGLNKDASNAYFNELMNRGIYYVYDKSLYILPKQFNHKDTIKYLEAIKLVSSYKPNNDSLSFVKEWITRNLKKVALEDFNIKPDGIIFPKTDNWRKKERKKSDLTMYFDEVLDIVNQFK